MPELTLSNVANLAEIIGASTILTGLIFGWVQLRNFRNQQRDAVARSLSETFYNRDLAAAIALIQSLPDGVGLQELRARGHEYEVAAVTVSTSFETMGILVFRRIAPLDLVADLAGGVISTMNRKLERYQEEIRIDQNQPSWGEWFTWLGEQVARVKSDQTPAHIAQRGWRP